MKSQFILEDENVPNHSGKHRNRKRVQVSRPIYSENDFQREYRYVEDHVGTREKITRKVEEIDCSPMGAWRLVLGLVPIFQWLPCYNFRDDILGDVISGLTTAVMRIPQAMAYAILATLPAVYGLYVAFFPVLVYAVLGTSRHISIGTWSIASIMTGGAIETILSKEENPPDDDTELRVQIAVSLCLLVGIIQAGMGILRLGIVTVYLSEPLVRGFTTGAAVHVFTSQFPKLFGIPMSSHDGVFSIIYTYGEFFTSLSEANPTAIITSFLCILFLVIVGEINEWQAHKGWLRKDGIKGKKLPLPSELVVVIVATAALYLGNFETKYSLLVVGDVPTGLPKPVVPPTKYMGDLVANAFAIVIVTLVISISVAQSYAKTYNYEIDANQEFLAYGSTHIVGSFFLCFPHAAAMSRTAVQEGSGGKTQLAGIISCGIVLIILLWLGPLLTQLPECALASIIVIALRGMFRQLKDLPMLWKASLVDFLLWFVTFFFVVLLDVDLGLLLGVIFALVTVVVRSQSPYCAVMGRIADTEIYRDIACIQDINEVPGIKIFRCSSSLSFINAEHFKKTSYKMVGINPQDILRTRDANKPGAMQTNEKSILTSSLFNKYSSLSQETTSAPSIHSIIIECGMFNYVDVVGVNTLQNVVVDFEKVGIRVVFANCKASVRKALLTITTINGNEEIGLDRMYISLHDAVLSCQDSSSVTQPVDETESTMTKTIARRDTPVRDDTLIEGSEVEDWNPRGDHGTEDWAPQGDLTDYQFAHVHDNRDDGNKR